MAISWGVATLVLLSGQAETERSSRECPELFGDPTTVDENRAFRDAHLNFVMDGEPYVTIVQFHDWSAPERAALRGIELLESSAEGAQVDVRLGLASCPDGIYRIAAGDSIGDTIRVLELLEEAVLIEHKRKLRYLPVEGVGPIDWEMAWTSRYDMTPYISKSRARPKRKAKARTSARRGRGK